jgi:endonuclease YncB( thermonuclease family)
MRKVIALASVLAILVGVGLTPHGQSALRDLRLPAFLGQLRDGRRASDGEQRPQQVVARPQAGLPRRDGLWGRATVIDGDTLDVAGVRVRLHGIDAPESRQDCERQGVVFACGAEAPRWLERAVGAREVYCTARDIDRNGRVVASCTAGGSDLGESLVRAGWAIAYRRYSTEYVAAEDEARVARRGLWAGRFEEPEAWRRAHPR